MRRQSRWYAVILTIALIFGVLSASMAVPIVCRPFYYAHIKALHLAETTPWTEAEIREAYDEMMDFCLEGEPFGTGVLKWSQDGMEHFADCAVLFRLDLNILKISAAVLLLGLILYIFGMRPKLLLRRGPLFWAGTLEMILFVVITGLAAMDFDRAFVTFHHIFFPGKTNWIFYYDVDEIINVLPEVFFRNCAILFVAILFALCILEIIADLRLHRKAR